MDAGTRALYEQLSPERQELAAEILRLADADPEQFRRVLALLRVLARRKPEGE